MMMTQPIDGSGNTMARPGGSRVPTKQSKPTVSAAVSQSASPSSESSGIDESAVKVDIQGLDNQQVEPTSESAPSQEQTLQRISEMVGRMRERTTTVDFQIEQDSNQVIVKVVNKETGETVRQLPPEEVLRLRESLTEFKGQLVEEIS